MINCDFNFKEDVVHHLHFGLASIHEQTDIDLANFQAQVLTKEQAVPVAQFRANAVHLPLCLIYFYLYILMLYILM